MELVHDFNVPVPADQAFDLLLDIKRVAPCLPGAVITSVDGDNFEGGMKIKLGPISMIFKGEGEMIEKDAVLKRAVIQARGRDAKGNGGAQATVTVSLTDRAGSTDAHVVTDLNVTGKAAQFGGGVMKDVSNRMLSQFAVNLSKLIESGDGPIDNIPNSAPASHQNDVQGAAVTAGRPHVTSAESSTQPVSAGDSFNALGLLPGGSALAKAARPTLIGLGCLVVGYLYGKNRVLERTVRSAR